MKTALLVIDYINGIVNGSCKQYIQDHPIIENTNKLIEHCRNSDIPIYFIRLAFEKGYPDIPKYSKMFNYVKENGLFQLGNPDTEFVTELDYQSSDNVMNKTGASPFHGNGLSESLKNNKIEKLIFSGISTDNAINSGVREANDAGYFTVVAEDACGGATEDFHRWTIEMLGKIANEILTTNEILSKLNT